MPYVRIQIVRFVDAGFPGFVAAEFSDAAGIKHSIIDKVPVIGLPGMWADSVYPQPGFAACELLCEQRDDEQRNLARITIALPWGLVATDGQTEFTVLRSEVVDEVQE